MLTKNVLIMIMVVTISGCTSNSTPPTDAFKLSLTSLEDKQMQTRQFTTVQRTDLLVASASVLQDLGYSLDESNSVLGVLSASKVIDAKDSGQIAGAILLAIFTGATSPVDDKQKIRVCLVINSDLSDDKSSLARITIQRLIWNDRGKLSRVQSVKDPELYDAFFTKLSKAVFLEANNI
ncbi:hypothetical protein RGQ13_11645 [Thalassotalea psychrophila]|uniref:Uncharacterized protein n=1 Tax=Thalassotalea psychrophila TaxID=3065647 RepID=A0ABY9TPN7_9GAMM|nr:hypothetical protein RGQ13_11645 [Colwelliaceae bacterium SQ149]